jgi:glutamate:gamma-aminobutyrate antiporter
VQKKGEVTKTVGLFGFFALTASMVINVYEYPTFATSQLNLLFFLIVGGVLWFLPVALCSAEMATVPEWEKGGVFTWVSKTLGERWGFMAIFFQWFQITVGFITMIYFMLSAISQIFSWSALNENPLLKTLGVLVIFWLVTFSQFRGTALTDKLAKYTFMLGIVVPAVVLLLFGVFYVLGGNPLQFSGSGKNFLPDFSDISTVVVFASFVLSYMGVEASATYSNELKDVQKNYPRAMLLLLVFLIAISAIGGLSISAIIPQKELSLSGGVLQAVDKYLKHFGLSSIWLLKGFSVLICIGIIGEVSTWVVGPVRGLYMAAQEGLLPPVFRKVNKHNVPVPLVLVQGIVVSVWAIVLTLFGGGNNLSFQVAISLTTTIYILMYVLFFIGYFVFVYKHKDLKGGYQVPGKKLGKTIIASSGFLCSLVVLVISFIAPSSIPKSEDRVFQLLLLTCFLITALLPFIIYQLNDKLKHKTIHHPIHFKASEVNLFIRPIGRGEEHILSDEVREKQKMM